MKIQVKYYFIAALVFAVLSFFLPPARDDLGDIWSFLIIAPLLLAWFVINIFALVSFIKNRSPWYYFVLPAFYLLGPVVSVIVPLLLFVAVFSQHYLLKLGILYTPLVVLIMIFKLAYPLFMLWKLRKKDELF